MITIFIRPIHPSDYEALIELDNLVWNETNSPSSIFWPSLEEFAKSRNRDEFVAVVDGVARGFISYKSPTPLPSNKHVWELSIGVHPIAQGKGIGRLLVKAVEERAKELGIQKLCLRVMATNTEAIRFYKSCGFLEQGRLVKEFCIRGKFVDDLLMYKMVNY